MKTVNVVVVVVVDVVVVVVVVSNHGVFTQQEGQQQRPHRFFLWMIISNQKLDFNSFFTFFVLIFRNSQRKLVNGNSNSGRYKKDFNKRSSLKKVLGV